MRVDTEQSSRVVTLSERNLLTLLTKLYTKGSAATIYNVDIVVRAELDENHYVDRPPPGEMHPVTEQILAFINEHKEGWSL